MVRRLALLGFLLANTVASLAPAATPVVFWHSMSGEKGKLLQSIIADFNGSAEAKEKIVVEPQFVGTYEEGINKLRAALLAGKGPHVVQITDIGTQVMIDSRAIVPLQDFTATDPQFPTAQLLAPIRRYYEVDGKLYSLPFATSNPVLYFNKSLYAKAGLKRPPQTFAELFEYSKILTDRSQRVTGITWPLHSWFFEQFLAKQGKPLLNQDNGRKARATEANYTSPEAIEFVTLWQNMVKTGVFANVGRGWEPAEQNFLAGRSAMLVTSTSDIFEIGRKASFPVGTAPLPAKAMGVEGGTIVGGNSLWILKAKPAGEQQAAYAFVRYMASKAAQRRWHQDTGYFPIRADVIADLEKEGFYAKHPNAKTAIDQMRSSPDMPATRGALMGVFSEARLHIETAIEKVLAGQLDAKAALQKAKEQTDQALVRYNKNRERLAD